MACRQDLHRGVGWGRCGPDLLRSAARHSRGSVPRGGARKRVADSRRHRAMGRLDADRALRRGDPGQPCGPLSGMGLHPTRAHLQGAQLGMAHRRAPSSSSSSEASCSDISPCPVGSSFLLRSSRMWKPTSDSATITRSHFAFCSLSGWLSSSRSSCSQRRPPGSSRPSSCARGRRWAILIIVIGAALITPSGDAFSLLVLSVPLYLMYEATYWLVRLVLKK